jgi:hypothetical protein
MKKRITLNTHSIQQKNQATKVLYEFSDCLGELLGEYLIPSIDSLLTLVLEKHSTDIRYSSALALSKMFSCVLSLRKKSPTSFSSLSSVNLYDYFTKALFHLMEAIKNEPDNNARLAQVESIRDLLDSIYQNGNEQENGSRDTSSFLLAMNEQLNSQLISFLLMQCADSLIRRNSLTEGINENDALDDEDKENAQEDALHEEDEILTVFIDIIGHLLKLQSSLTLSSFMNLFDTAIAPAFSTYLSSNQPLALQRMVSCLLDDIIEFSGENGKKYIPSLLPIFLMNSQSTDLLLRQCSMYGLGMMVYKSSDTLLATKIPSSSDASGSSSYIGPMLSCFVTTILSPDASEEEIAGITENAIFGLFCLLSTPIYRSELMNQSNHFPLLDLYSLSLKKLPLKLDSNEVKITMMSLCSLIENNDTVLFSRNNTGNNDFLFVSDMLRVFGEVLAMNTNGKATQKSLETTPNSVAALHSDDDDNNMILHERTLQRMDTILRQFKQANMISPSQVQEFPLRIQAVLKNYC